LVALKNAIHAARRYFSAKSSRGTNGVQLGTEF